MDVFRSRPAPSQLVIVWSLLILPGLCAAGAPALAACSDSAAQEEQSAAEATEDQKPEKAPTPASTFTERVTVTATKVDVPSTKVGSALSVITVEELEDKQIRLVVDALRTVPGLDVRRTGGPGSVTSLFIRGNDSDHTLVLVDGVEMNDPSSPSRLPFVADLTSDEVDRIEIVRGPQSTLFGSDAIGGVVNIITRKGRGEPAGTVWAEGGSYGTWREGASASGGIGNFNFTLGASHAGIDGFSAKAGGDEPDFYRNTSLNSRFGWEFGEAAGLDLFVRRTDAEVAFDGFSSEEGNQIDVGQTLLKAEPRFKLMDGRWEQKVSLQAVRHERETTGSTPSRVQGDLLSLGWQNDLLLGAGQTLTVGLEGEQERADFQSFKDRADTTAIYAQHLLETDSGLFGAVGIRLDDHSEFGSQATYRVAGGRAFAPHRLILRGSYGTGFKAPSLSQLNPQAFAGNPDLEAEHSQGADLGLEHEALPGRLSLGATLFWSRVDDLIIGVFDPAIAEFRNFNIDEAAMRGVEASITLQPLASLALRADYTYTHTEALGNPAGFGLQEGSPLLRRPEHKASFFAHAGLGGKTDLALTALYVGRRADIDPQTFSIIDSPGYFVVDLAGSRALGAHLRILARMENLLDRRYEDVAGFTTARISGYAGIRIGF
jgi:vitamin B12 transporter